MNPIADLKSDSLRTLFIYVVPGGVALLPWVCLFIHELPGTLDFCEKHQPLAAVVALVLCLSVGKFMDGIGTVWEAEINDCVLRKDKKFSDFDAQWSAYIRTAFVHEPVAVDYIRNLTQTLKFELNLGVALAVFAIGLLVLWGVLPNFSGCTAAVAACFSLVLGAGSLWSSLETSRVLASVRKWLDEGVLLRPKKSE